MRVVSGSLKGRSIKPPKSLAYSSYDLIFCDPPFDFPELETIPSLVFENELLNENGTLIVEHGERTSLVHGENFVNCRKFGSVNFSFFEV